MRTIKIMLALIILLQGLDVYGQSLNTVTTSFITEDKTAIRYIESITLRCDIDENTFFYVDKSIDLYPNQVILIHQVRWRRDGSFNSYDKPYEIIGFLFSGPVDLGLSLSANLIEVEDKNFIDGYWQSYTSLDLNQNVFGGLNFNTMFTVPKIITNGLIRLYCIIGNKAPPSNYLVAIVDYEVITFGGIQ